MTTARKVTMGRRTLGAALLLALVAPATGLAQRTAKEQLQKHALAEVQNVLKAEGAPAKVEAVYFTSLVTQ